MSAACHTANDRSCSLPPCHWWLELRNAIHHWRRLAATSIDHVAKRTKRVRIPSSKAISWTIVVVSLSFIKSGLDQIFVFSFACMETEWRGWNGVGRMGGEDTLVDLLFTSARLGWTSGPRRSYFGLLSLMFGGKDREILFYTSLFVASRAERGYKHLQLFILFLTWYTRKTGNVRQPNINKA